MGSYIFSKARKTAFRAAQKKAWGMRRGTTVAEKAVSTKGSARKAVESAQKSWEEAMRYGTAESTKAARATLRKAVSKAKSVGVKYVPGFGRVQ